MGRSGWARPRRERRRPGSASPGRRGWRLNLSYGRVGWRRRSLQLRPVVLSRSILISWPRLHRGRGGFLTGIGCVRPGWTSAGEVPQKIPVRNSGRRRRNRRDRAGIAGGSQMNDRRTQPNEESVGGLAEDAPAELPGDERVRVALDGRRAEPVPTPRGRSPFDFLPVLPPILEAASLAALDGAEIGGRNRRGHSIVGSCAPPPETIATGRNDPGKRSRDGGFAPTE